MNNDTDYKICSICNSLISNENILNIKDEDICKSCVEKMLEKERQVNPLTTLLCSFIPGVGELYLGLRKKGKFLLFTFLLSNLFMFFSWFIGFVVLEAFFWEIGEFIGISSTIIFGILDILVYVYSFFNTNMSRRYIEKGTYENDFVDNFIDKTLKNKKDNKMLEEKIIDKRLQ